MVRQILLKEGRGVGADSGGGTFFFCLRLEAQVFFIHILQDTQLKTYCAVYKINIYLTNVDER